MFAPQALTKSNVRAISPERCSTNLVFIRQATSINVNAVSESDASNREAMDVSTMSDEVTNAVNQLPESDQGGLPGIRELLTQLQSAIEGNDELPPQEKAEALAQVKVLAAAGKNPQVEEKRSHAQTALGVLRGKLASSPKPTNLIQLTTLVLPQIAEVFGLQ